MVKKHVIIIFILLIIIFGLNFVFESSCLFYIITGINCPFCGITRAHLCMLKLNVSEALNYHFFFYLGIPYLFLIVHKDADFIKWKKVVRVIIIIVTIVYLSYYLYRLIYYGTSFFE